MGLGRSWGANIRTQANTANCGAILMPHSALYADEGVGWPLSERGRRRVSRMIILIFTPQ